MTRYLKPAFRPTCPRCGVICHRDALYCVSCGNSGKRVRLYPASFYPERKR